MELDHVLIAVTDLADAASACSSARTASHSIEGGRHPGWGTANRIVPLGDSYLELIAVVDEREAATSAARSLGRGRRDRDRTADRLGCAPRRPRLRRRSDSASSLERRLARDADGRARSAGERPASTRPSATPSLPVLHRAGSGHAASPARVDARPRRSSRLEIEATPAELAAWLGDTHCRLRSRGGTRLATVVLAGRDGEIVIGESRRR